jgi:acetoin utilization protein AcuB
MPSKATSLCVYEVNYLLNKTTVRDVMIKDIETISPEALLEDGIAIMRSKNIGVLPVVEGPNLLGIITNNDIFDAFLKITGYNNGGTRVTIQITEDQKGILADIAQLLANNDFSIATIVVNRVSDGTIIEIQVESQAVATIQQALESAGYNVVNAVLTNQ